MAISQQAAAVAASLRGQVALAIAEDHPVPLVGERTAELDENEDLARLLGQGACADLRRREGARGLRRQQRCRDNQRSHEPHAAECTASGAAGSKPA